MDNIFPASWSLGQLESKVLGRNEVDSLDELKPEQLEREIRAAKSLVKQAQGRKEEPKFRAWVKVLENTRSGETHSLSNMQNRDRLLRRIESHIIRNDVKNYDDIISFMKALVEHGKMSKNEFNTVKNSDEFEDLVTKYTVNESLTLTEAEYHPYVMLEVDDVLSNMIGNASDKQISRDIKFFNRIKKVLNTKHPVMFHDEDSTYDPEYYRQYFDSITDVNGFNVYYIDGISLTREQADNGELYLYFRSEYEGNEYCNRVDHMYDDDMNPEPSLHNFDDPSNTVQVEAVNEDITLPSGFVLQGTAQDDYERAQREAEEATQQAEQQAQEEAERQQAEQEASARQQAEQEAELAARNVRAQEYSNRVNQENADKAQQLRRLTNSPSTVGNNKQDTVDKAKKDIVHSLTNKKLGSTLVKSAITKTKGMVRR